MESKNSLKIFKVMATQSIYWSFNYQVAERFYTLNVEDK